MFEVMSEEEWDCLKMYYIKSWSKEVKEALPSCSLYRE